ncbi:MAG: protein-disulfide reductase DsbD family protein [Rhodobacteraceae bacterium]|nr:protein-disulfide reductase DsbD family protein [Paracoccaceae bacterium]
MNRFGNFDSKFKLAAGLLLALATSFCLLAISLSVAHATMKPNRSSTSVPVFGPPTDIVKLTIRPGWRGSKGRSAIHYAGLHIQLAKGWYTYWRKPGMYGVPLQADWTGSRNLSEVEILWPTPTLIGTADVMVLGYRDAVTLPLIVRPHRADEPVAVRARIFFGVCKEVCIPVMQTVSQQLSPQLRKPDPTILAAIAHQPPLHIKTQSGPGFECNFTASDGRIRVATRFGPHEQFRDSLPLAVFEYFRPGIRFGSARVTRGSDGSVFAMAEAIADETFDSSRLLVSLFSQQGARQFKGC